MQQGASPASSDPEQPRKVPSKSRRMSFPGGLWGSKDALSFGATVTSETGEDAPMLNFGLSATNLKRPKDSSTSSSSSSLSVSSVPSASGSDNTLKKRRGSFGVINRSSKGPLPDTTPQRLKFLLHQVSNGHHRMEEESGLKGVAFRKKGTEWRAHTLSLEDISQILVIREALHDETKGNTRIVPVTSCKVATKYRHGYAVLVLQDPVCVTKLVVHLLSPTSEPCV